MDATDDTLQPDAGGSATPRMLGSRRNSNYTASELTDDEDQLSDHGNWLANEVEPGAFRLSACNTTPPDRVYQVSTSQRYILRLSMTMQRGMLSFALVLSTHVSLSVSLFSYFKHS